jgi:hypothetical protein
MKIYLKVILFALIIGCVPNKKVKESNMSAVETNFNSLKKYDNEPIYKMTIQTEYSYKVYVNDILLLSRFSHIHAPISFFINSALFKSGKQNIKINLYPSFTDATTQELTLTDKFQFSLDLVKTAWKNGILIEPQNILSYKIPTPTNETKNSDFTNSEEYIVELPFEAKLPYEMNPLENSKNLKKEDTTNLKKEVLDFYNSLKTNFESKQSEVFMKKIAKAENLVYQCNYLTKEEAVAKNAKWVDYINSGQQLSKIENYDMEISSTGKLVSLRRNDGQNNGEAVLRVNYTNDIRQNRTLCYDVVLHKPTNSDSLEIFWLNMLDKN